MERSNWRLTVLSKLGKLRCSQLVNIKKAITLFVTMLILTITTAYGQQLQPDSLNKANHITYRADISTFNTIMNVYNQNNILEERIQKTNPRYFFLKKNDNLSLLNSFKQAFSKDRLAQLANEPGITVLFKLSVTGKVLEVSFIIHKNTLITSYELEALEDAIKKNVSFTLHSDQTKGGDFFMIGQNVKFSKILDGSLNRDIPPVN
jgi:hypothetical protein